MNYINKTFAAHTFNSRLLLAEMHRRKITLKPFGRTKLVKATLGKHSEMLFDIYTNQTPYTNGIVIDDKFYSKNLLSYYGFNVNQGQIFNKASIDISIDYAKSIGFPIVLKPTISSNGDGVVMDVENSNELKIAIINFYKKFPSDAYFLIEEQHEGNEYRLFINKNGFFAAVNRIPANIEGNGVDTLKDLIKKENYRRMNPRNTCLCEIRLDSTLRTFLKKQGISLKYVPQKKETIKLRKNSNVSTGGNCYDVTDLVNPFYIKLAKNILKDFGASFIGIDLLCGDISKNDKSYKICELNSAPGLSLHVMPEKGKSRNVAAALVDVIFPETYDKSKYL